jgi:hypothetical protein
VIIKRNITRKRNTEIEIKKGEPKTGLMMKERNPRVI